VHLNNVGKHLNRVRAHAYLVQESPDLARLQPSVDGADRKAGWAPPCALNLGDNGRASSLLNAGKSPSMVPALASF
jgi:hypothetical protein